MTKATATKLGKAAQTKLRAQGFKGWKLQIWKSASWHVRLTKGAMALHISKGIMDEEPSYWTLMSTDIKQPVGGEIFWTTGHKTFRNPALAVSYQISMAMKHIKLCQKAVHSVVSNGKK